jgi:hypothetical protein
MCSQQWGSADTVQAPAAAGTGHRRHGRGRQRPTALPAVSWIAARCCSPARSCLLIDRKVFVLLLPENSTHKHKILPLLPAGLLQLVPLFEQVGNLHGLHLCGAVLRVGGGWQAGGGRYSPPRLLQQYSWGCLQLRVI